MSGPLPDTLDIGLREARHLLEQGAQDRHSAAHAPVVGSVDANGEPAQRVMVLRQCDWGRRRLRFHTDARSPKVGQLSDAPVSVLVHAPGGNTQLRIAGRASIETESGAADAAWAASTDFSRRCYLAQPGPSTPAARATSGVPSSIEGRAPSEEELAPARANFALLFVEMRRIDWLYLDPAGHRRARYSWDGGEWRGEWLVP